MYDYIHLHTDDYKIAFCQATNELCQDVQRIIWSMSEKYENDIMQPKTPEKKSEKISRLPTKRLETLVRKWREQWGDP